LSALVQLVFLAPSLVFVMTCVRHFPGPYLLTQRGVCPCSSTYHILMRYISLEVCGCVACLTFIRYGRWLAISNTAETLSGLYRCQETSMEGSWMCAWWLAVEHTHFSSQSVAAYCCCQNMSSFAAGIACPFKGSTDIVGTWAKACLDSCPR
jgi:hypothetical protein